MRQILIQLGAIETLEWITMNFLNLLPGTNGLFEARIILGRLEIYDRDLKNRNRRQGNPNLIVS